MSDLEDFPSYEPSPRQEIPRPRTPSPRPASNLDDDVPVYSDDYESDFDDDEDEDDDELGRKRSAKKPIVAVKKHPNNPNNRKQSSTKILSSAPPPSKKKLLDRRSSKPTANLYGANSASSPNLLTVAAAPASKPGSIRLSPNPVAATEKFIAERVRSAQLREKKEKMNSVRVLQRELKDLREENRLLQRQVKRQSTELERIAGARGELPTILHSHNEEVRVLKDKIKRLAQANKDLEVKLDKRDSILLKMKEVNKTLNSLNQNKGFDAKQKMLSDLEELKAQLELRDEENKDMRRKLNLTEKSLKQQLSRERGQNQAMLKKLDAAEKHIEKLKDDIKEKEKAIHRSNIYAHRIGRPGTRMRGQMSSASSMMSLHFAEEEEDEDQQQRPASKTLNVNGNSRRKTSPSIHSSSGAGDDEVEVPDPIADFVERELKEIAKKSAKIKENIQAIKSPLLKSSISVTPSSPEKSSSISIGSPLSNKSASPPRKVSPVKVKSPEKAKSPEKSKTGEKPAKKFGFESEIANEKTKGVKKIDFQEPAKTGADLDETVKTAIAVPTGDNASRPKSLYGMRRENSFETTKKFFEDQDHLLGQKDYIGEKTTKDNKEEDKTAIWMPKGTTTASSSSANSGSGSRSSSISAVTVINKDKTENSPSSRRYSATPPKSAASSKGAALSEDKKASLLAQLNQIDGVENNSPEKKEAKSDVYGYSPSFGTKQRETSAGKNLLAKASSEFKAASDLSLNSSVGSIDSKKSSLMKELFDDAEKDSFYD